MRKLTLSLSVLVLVLFLISCAPTAPEQPTAPAPKPVLTEPSTETVDKVPEQKLSPAVEQLVSKNHDTTNYKFLLDAFDTNSYEVSVKENKVKKVYTNPVKYQRDKFYTTVYLDLTARTAVATCEEPGVLCESIWGKYMQLNFNDQQLSLTPLTVIENIGNDATIVGTENFENRAATIIEYTNDAGMTERVSIDTYYGLPLRQEIYSQQGDERVLQQKHTFTRQAVGSVKNAEVTLSAEYELLP